MALIQCPECSKEISDKVTSCPHCGFPFKEEKIETESTPQKVELTKVKLKTSEKTKRYVILGIISLVIIIGVSMAIKTFNEKKAYNAYIDNLHTAQTLMISGGATAEDLNNLTKKVWYNAIYEEYDSETDAYTRPNGYFFSDFNLALASLHLDSSTIEKVSLIEENQEDVKFLMKELQNPPEGLEQCYETLNDLYTSYSSFTNLAISPTGSLSSYSESVNTKSATFMESYEALTNQIPEKK